MPARPHANRSLDTRDEKAVQAAVVRLLRSLGYAVSDFSQSRATQQTPGVPDLHAMHPGHGRTGAGHSIWVEVKTAQGRLRPSQVAWHTAAREAGQTVLVARSAADLVAPLRALGAPVR